MVALQIRDVPEAIRDELARAAANEGVSLQVFLHEVIHRAASSARNRRLITEWGRAPLLPDDAQVDIVQLIADSRAERDERIRSAVLGGGDA